MRRMGASSSVCPTNETLKVISDWCGLCYRGLKIKVSVLILLCNFESGCLSQSGDGSSNCDRGSGTV